MPAGDIFNLPIEWVWLITLSAALNMEWSIRPFWFRHHHFRWAHHNAKKNLFMFITKCLQCCSVEKMWINNSGSDIKLLGERAWFYYVWFCSLVKFSLDWLAHRIHKGVFTIYFLLNWIENAFFCCVFSSMWIAPCLGTSFGIWSLWCVYVLSQSVIRDLFVMHTMINMCTIWTLDQGKMFVLRR